MIFRLATICLCAFSLFLAGCDMQKNTAVLEEDDSDYRHGKDLLRQGRNQEALASFLKVIEHRGGGAPESHLDAGILYQEHIKDPVAAIYHYRKFRELKPNSKQSGLVSQRIDAAMREFARTLPMQPAGGQLQHADLLKTIGQLREENTLLNSQIVTLKDTIARQHQAAAATSSRQQPAATTASNPPPQRQAVQQSTSIRKHIVIRGDTLSAISLKYYNNRSRWQEIYDANRDVMRSENDLQIGMELRVP